MKNIMYKEGFTTASVIVLIVLVLLGAVIIWYFFNADSVSIIDDVQTAQREESTVDNFKEVDDIPAPSGMPPQNSGNQPLGQSSTSLTLSIDTIPVSSQPMTFVVQGISSEPGVYGTAHTLVLDANSATQAPRITSIPLAPGTYSIAVAQVSGWTTAWACQPGLEGGIDSGSGSQHAVDIGSGYTIECSYSFTQ